MINSAEKKTTKILLHVLGWALLIVVLFMYPPLADTSVKLPGAFWVKTTIHISTLVFAFYINTLYMVPKLFFRGKIIIFIACMATWCILSSYLLSKADIWLNLYRQMEHAFGRKIWPNLNIDFFALITTILIFGISTAITVMERWSNDAKARQEFESHQVTMELSFLKAQINPHFLFNTLNNIYALTYVDVETSRKSLYKLSHMMRYLLYETQQNTTLLTKEIEFIKDYVEIMKLRLRENIILLLNVPENIVEMPVAPMLLLPFIENAFKHGIDDRETSVIKILIEQTATGITLNVINNIYAQPEHIEQTEDRGIGLINTKRRLDLLYPTKYMLSVTEKAGQYNMFLTLTLEST